MEMPAGVLPQAWIDQLHRLAKQAARGGDVPVSALCVHTLSGEMMRANNQVQRRNNPLAHAENLVIAKMVRKQDSRYLTQAHLISSLEPCVMCLGAMMHARIPFLTYVCQDEKDGYFSRHGVVIQPETWTRVRIGSHVFKVYFSPRHANIFQRLLSDFFLHQRGPDQKQL